MEPDPWDDDEDDDDEEPLPVLDPDAPSPAATAHPEHQRRPVGRSAPPRGNVKRGDAKAARAAVADQATGRARPEPAEWRQELADGNRTRAADRLSARRPTHNAGTGFGLA